METRANYALVGLFTLAVIAAGFGFVYWFRGAAQNGERAVYRIVFTGSVSGLVKGSVVRFNGLRVGEVTDISLIPNEPSRVQALVEVDRTTPIKVDTKARLEYQGLTGVAAVQLAGGTAEAQMLATPDGAGSATIFADRSDFQDILETVQRLSGRVDDVLGRADRILVAAEGPIVNTARNAEAFSRVLADNSTNVSALLASGGEMTQRIGSLAQRLERFTDEAEALIRSLDAASINRSVGNVERATAAFANRSGEIEGLITDASTLVRQLTEPGGALQGTLQNAETFSRALAQNSGRIETIAKAVEDVAQRLAAAAVRVETFVAQAGDIAQALDAASINRSVGNVERVSAALANRSGEIEGLLADASTLARRLADPEGALLATLQNAETISRALAENAGRVDTIAKAVEDVTQRLASAAGRVEGFVAQASGIAEAIDPGSLNRTLSNVEQFTGTLATSRANVEQLIADAGALARRLNESTGALDQTLEDVSRLVRSVDADKVNRTLDGAEKFAAALGNQAGSIEQALKEASEITAKVNKSAERLDSVLAGAEKLLNSGEGQSVIAEIGDTARSIRTLADNLDKRTADISAGISRFTGPGLRELEALAADARRAVGDVSRAVRSLERNPQQVLTGGRSAIPEYGGRR